MQQIDEARLEADIVYRFRYLAEFINFGEDDIAVLQDAAPLLAPVVPALVDAVYQKLSDYDAAWRHFVPRQEGYEGDVPLNLEELTVDHPQITFRKHHLGRYLESLVTAPYDRKMILYLDTVGAMHTAQAGNPGISVPLVQMNALLGFVNDAVIAAVLGFDIPAEAKGAAIRAFTKLLWIQNDLISRHYAPLAPP